MQLIFVKQEKKSLSTGVLDISKQATPPKSVVSIRILNAVNFMTRFLEFLIQLDFVTLQATRKGAQQYSRQGFLGIP